MRLGFKRCLFERKIKGFTLAESMITIVIVAILAAVTIPLLNKSKPDQNDLMHKKATYIVERVVNELVTDEFLYPNNSELNGLGNLSPVAVNGVTHQGPTKFCTLFASRLNRAAGSEIDCTPGKKSVRSVEGIDWYLPIATFEGAQVLRVDVNGDEAPNCTESAACKRPDQFQYQLKAGTRVPVTEIGTLAPTVAPGARLPMGAAPNPNEQERTGQNWWGIYCGSPAHGQIYGAGGNKPNGNYKLVAIPDAGYKGSWFTKNVTIENNDVTEAECSVLFEPLTCAVPGACPEPDGPPPPVITPPTDPDNPDGPKTYCINVVNSDPVQCPTAGNGCGKKPGPPYIVTVDPKSGYTPSWKEQKVSIVDKDVTLTLDCTKNDACYNITTSGDTTNCPVTLPTPNCKSDKTKFKTGTHDYIITPKAGYTFGEATTPTKRQAIIVDKDIDIPIECKSAAPLPPVVDIYLEDSFDGVWQEPLSSNPSHVYVKNYFYTRTLKVDVPNVYVKMKFSGKYTGETLYCPENPFPGNCTNSNLTLGENGVDPKFKQSLTQELANGAKVRWQSFQELGLGGHSGSKQIKSVWNKYSITINDVELAKDKAMPPLNGVEEYKIGTTTFKVHFVDAPRIYVRVINVDRGGDVITGYAPSGYAWISAKTNVVWAAAGGGSTNHLTGTPFYTYLEPHTPHLAHIGDSVTVNAAAPWATREFIYYPTAISFNGSQKCSKSWGGNGFQYFDCDFKITGAPSYPSLSEITTSFDQCSRDTDRPSCCSGGYMCFEQLYTY